MKKLVTLIAVVAFAIPFLTPRAEAQFSFIPYGGYDLDWEALFVGVGTEFALPITGLPFGLNIRPSAEYYFLDSPTGFSHSFFQINGDVVTDVLTEGPVGVFAGAGLGIGIYSVDTDVPFLDGSSTDIGLNLLGGAEFGTGSTVPFAMVRLSTMPGTRFLLGGGVKLVL